MWLMDHQMNLSAAEQFGQYYARPPLTQSATIIHANAPRIDWESVVPEHELSYILGNPPFKGFKYATQDQDDTRLVFGDICKTALLDYVSAWYKKAANTYKERISKWHLYQQTALREADKSANCGAF